MKILITGATGFTGVVTTSLLLKQGYQIRCFARSTSDVSRLDDKRIEWVYGDVADFESLKEALNGIDVLVNIVSLGFGHAPVIVKAAEDSNIKRAIFISTTALFTSLNAPSKKIRQEAENIICRSTLDYTILRPTMIYGSSQDRNMWRLIKFVKRFPIIPIFGDGNMLQQPVYVEDVAQAIVKSMLSDTTIRKAYNISGAHPLTYNEVVDTVANVLNRKILKLHFPKNLMIKGLSLIEKTPLKLPIKAEQVQRLNENKAFDFRDASNDFDYQPRTFAEGISLELQELRSNG